MEKNRSEASDASACGSHHSGPMKDSDSQHAAFIRLLSRHEPVIRASIRSVVRRAEDLEEVMQMTSLAAWNKFDTLEDHDQFARWACVIARFETLTFQRNKARDRFELNLDLVALIIEEAAEESPLRSRRLELLNDCLQELPEARRALVMQAYQPGCSIQELAEGVGRTRDSLYQLLRRIRVMLLKCVDARLAAKGGA